MPQEARFNGETMRDDGIQGCFILPGSGEQSRLLSLAALGVAWAKSVSVTEDKHARSTPGWY